jgi:hypothetical protein
MNTSRQPFGEWGEINVESFAYVQTQAWPSRLKRATTAPAGGDKRRGSRADAEVLTFRRFWGTADIESFSARNDL